MTGLYTYKLECFDNSQSFKSEIPTYAHYLTLAGYNSVLSGKMHFVGPDQLHGLTFRLTTDCYPSDFSWLPRFIDKESHLMQDPWGNASQYTPEQTVTKEWTTFRNYDEETHLRAIEYLYGEVPRRDPDKPFCLCVSYHHPHDPFTPPKKYYDLYEGVDFALPDLGACVKWDQTIMDTWLANGFHRTDKYNVTTPRGLQELRRCYAALVTYIDDKVGELLSSLKDKGLLENTVILFTSDHGDLLGERGMVQKRHFYEWSTRIPMIIRFPGGAFAGETRRGACSLLDVAPTLVELAGAGCEDAPSMDGVSLMRYLKNPAYDRDIFVEYHGEGVIWPCFMIRSGPYKYFYIHEKKGALFNVVDDPKELVNLIDEPEHQETCRLLQSKILHKFDPERVQSYLTESLQNRSIVREANRISGVSWDYTPENNGAIRYARNRVKGKLRD